MADMRSRGGSVLGLMMVLACGDDAPTTASGSGTSANPPSEGTVTGTATSSGGEVLDSSTGVAATSSTATTGSTTSTGSSGSASSSSTDGGETETTGPAPACERPAPGVPPQCGDGMLATGELCYETSPPVQIAGTSVARVWAGDLDDDNDPDALVLVEFPAALTVFLNQGGGVMVQDDTYPLAPGQDTGVLDVDAADMDGDTYVDAVIAADAPPSLRVLTNDGGGAFGFPIVFMLQTVPQAVALADIDGDLLTDAVVVTDQTLSVHFGLGNGSFGMTEQLADPTLVDPQDLVIHDFDGDGDPDVAAAFSQRVAVYLNDNGALGFPSTVVVATSIFGPDDIAVGDVTADDIPDIVVADAGDGVVQLLVGAGDGSFVADPAVVDGSYVVLGNANSDCGDDVLTVTPPGLLDDLTVYPSDSMGGLGAEEVFALRGGITGIDGADFNADSRVDVLFAVGAAGEIGVVMSEP